MFWIMSTSLVVLELWQFLFIRNWTEIQKLEITPSELYQISEPWGELGIPSLTWMYLTKCHRMLQNAKVTTFTVSELLRKNQQEDKEGGDFNANRLKGYSIIKIDSQWWRHYVWKQSHCIVKINRSDCLRHC